MCLRHASMGESPVFLWIVVFSVFLLLLVLFCLKLCDILSLDFETI